VAQECNEDVLLEILAGLSPQNLAACASLCRSWLPAARTMLYRHIEFNSVLPSAYSLEYTLRTHPHLRNLIRHLVISHPHDTNDYLLGWIALLPENSLLSIRLDRMPQERESPFAVLEYPAVRTVRQVVITQHTSYLLHKPERLSTILSYSCLTSLTLAIPKSLPLTLSRSLQLSRLSIGLFYEESPEMLVRLLRTIETPLERLDVVMRLFTEAGTGRLVDGLQPHLPHLKRFGIRAADPSQTVPAMDVLICSLPSLRVLACGRNIYTATLFKHLPSSLHTLMLESRDNDAFPVDAMCREVTRLCREHGALRRLTIGRQPSFPAARYFQELRSICMAHGVSFRISKLTVEDYFA
jgi:hypothetical protein